jgi:hypothetical protein
MTSPSLSDYIKHAERFGRQCRHGVQCIYEAAETDGLSAVDLGCLARHLRRIDNNWRLTAAQRERLILRLLSEGIADKKIRDMADISQDTLARLRKQSETCDSELTGPVSMRREVRKSSWDREYPYQTIYAYFSELERRSWPTPRNPSQREDHRLEAA